MLWIVKLDKRLLLNGVGYKEKMVGKSIGQPYQQLPKAASNSQSVDARPLAMPTDSASATKSSFPAPNCALAIADNNVCSRKKVVIMSKSISMHYRFVNQILEQSYFQTVCKFDHLKRINFNNLLYSLQKI